MRGNIKKLYEYRNIEIVEDAVCSDHVHLCVSILHKESVSNFVGYLKGKLALMIIDMYPEQIEKWSKTRRLPLIEADGISACDTRLLVVHANSPYRANIKPPFEMVVADLVTLVIVNTIGG